MLLRPEINDLKVAANMLNKYIRVFYIRYFPDFMILLILY